MRCVQADYGNIDHARDVILLLNNYACDPMGGGSPLSDDVKKHLIPRLKNTAHALSILYYDDRKAVGLMNCFEGFSTFSAAPLINIHDVFVEPAYRGRGVLDMMFKTLTNIATDLGCCKITLEVLEGNQRAKAAYSKLGFKGYELLNEAGNALFWQKKLL